MLGDELTGPNTSASAAEDDQTFLSSLRKNRPTGDFIREWCSSIRNDPEFRALRNSVIKLNGELNDRSLVRKELQQRPAMLAAVDLILKKRYRSTKESRTERSRKSRSFLTEPAKIGPIPRFSTLSSTPIKPDKKSRSRSPRSPSRLPRAYARSRSARSRSRSRKRRHGRRRSPSADDYPGYHRKYTKLAKLG